MEELIAKRYANAILSSSDLKSISNYSDTLTILSNVIKSSKDIQKELSSPMLSKETKASIIIDSIGDAFDSGVSNFIKLLAEKGRLNIIPLVSKIINSELQKKENSYNGVIKSKNNLSSDEIKNLEDKLSSHTGSKITLSQEISDNDGMKVSVDDLGIEVDFSKERVKSNLIDFISRAI